MQLLLGLYPVQDSCLILGGKPLRLQDERFEVQSEPNADTDLRDLYKDISEKKSLSLYDYRRHFSFIPQEAPLLRLSLKANVDIQNLWPVSQLNVWAQKVGLDKLISKLNKGWDFPIEENGKNLSLGERQLVALTRSLAFQSPILILDEATASVDPQSEENMMRATQDIFSEQTQIIIAHRLSSIKHCDYVIWLDKGQIRDMGPADIILDRFVSDKSHNSEMLY